MTTPIARALPTDRLPHGWQVLAIEGALHFQLMTGMVMPPNAALDLRAPLRVVDPSLTEES